MDELLKDDLIRVTKRCNLFRFIHVISDGGEFETTFKDIYPEELELNNEKFRSPQGIIFGLHVLIENRKTTVSHCVKNARIRSYYGPHFPAFGLNTLRIRSECGKIWTRITPNTDTFYAVGHLDKRDSFPFSIVGMPCKSSNPLPDMFYSATGAETLRIAKANVCTDSFYSFVKPLMLNNLTGCSE